MLDYLAERLDVVLLPIARLLARNGISPNAITIVHLILSLAAAAVLAAGPAWFSLGAAIILLAFILDVVDGLLADTTDQVTLVGDFLDATLDRYEDGAFYL